jgi:lysozyme family protein
MASFSVAIDIILGHEKGYQNNPNDSGNFVCGVNVGTNFGISAPVLKDWLGRCPTASDMKNLTRDTAIRIYLTKYWNQIKGDELKNQSLANALFDTHVNGGLKSVLQKTFKELSISTSPTIPFNSETVSAINKANQEKLFETFKSLREQRFKDISNSTFISGWLSRNESFEFIKNNKGKIFIFIAIISLLILSYYFFIVRKGKLNMVDHFL